MKKEEKKPLPYYVTKENVNKLINAIKLKEGAEDSIKAYFGKGKYLETKRTLQAFNVISKDMRLTESGRIIAYSQQDEVENEWFKIIMNYKPYEEFIQSYRLNDSTKETEGIIEFESVKNFWGLRNYGTSDNNRNDALLTFAYFIILAGIGKFENGKKKGIDKIIILNEKLEEKVNNLCSKEEKNDENDQIDETKNITKDDMTIETGKEKDEQVEQNNKVNLYNIEIPIASGEEAKIIIPEGTDEDEAKLIKSIIDVFFKNKFGI